MCPTVLVTDEVNACVTLPIDMFLIALKGVNVDLAEKFFEYYEHLDQEQQRTKVKHPKCPTHIDKFQKL